MIPVKRSGKDRVYLIEGCCRRLPAGICRRAPWPAVFRLSKMHSVETGQFDGLAALLGARVAVGPACVSVGRGTLAVIALRRVCLLIRPLAC